MIRIVSALILVLSIVFITGCKNDPVNSDIGSEGKGVGEFKTVTVTDISYKNFIQDSLQVLYNPATGTNLTMMNKVGVESRIALILGIKPEVNHHVAEIYLKSGEYVGDDFETAECPVYYITEEWFDDYNQDSRWENYTDMIGTEQIGSLTITASDTTTDTLRITNLTHWDQMADTSITPKNYGIFIDLPETVSGDFIKNYKAIASGNVPQYHYQYKYIDDGINDPDTTLYGKTTNIAGNHIIIKDESDIHFSDVSNYYYLKTFTPSHLLLDVPFDNVLNIIQDKNIFFMGAYLHVPIDTNASYYESSFREYLYLHPATDTSQTTRITYSANYGYMSIPISALNEDSSYVYNSSVKSQQELGKNVFKAGLEDSVFRSGWLIEPERFDRYFNVFAIPKDRKPKLILKYYERQDARF